MAMSSLPARDSRITMTDRTPSLQEIASCVAGYDPDALPVAQAQDFIARLVPIVQAVELRPIRDALGRVLARDIVSAIDVPAHDNSAMDGYALRGSELRADAPTRAAHRRQRPGRTELCRRGAGDGLRAHHHRRGHAGRAGYGGAAGIHPASTATQVLVPPGLLRAGDNRRLAGEDLARGEAALAAGRVLRPADLGLLASLGLAEVPVRRRLRVAFFSTGDELRSIGEPLDAGCVYDSNRYTLWGMLQRLGVEAIDLGVVRDEPAALRETFTQAAACADAVITSGGVSVGEADHTKRIMAELGEVLFWKIAMRPGRPDGHRAHRRCRPPGHPVRPAGQPGGGDGDLLCLRARRAAAHGRRHGRAVAAAARGQRRADPQEARAAPSTSAASSAAPPTAAGRWRSPAHRAAASCAA